FDDLTKDFSDLLTARTPLLVEVRPGGSGDYFRAWAIPATDNRSGAVDDLEQDELSFQLEGDKNSACSWGQ
ncbi:MAG TPA: hypothetical protein GXX28_00530, partial [Firmicutes bacterium]|nr:hypothetical protein [Bacillota bacterium]